jgi:Flp pilus assembly protein TadD
MKELQDAEMFLRLFKQRSEAGEFESAVLQTQSLIDICSACPHFYAMKVKMLIKARKVSDAVEFSETAVTLFPNNIEILEWRAKATYYDGSEALAKKAINQAFSLDPDN